MKYVLNPVILGTVIFTLFLSVFAAKALATNCQPNHHSCDFYQCLENQVQCGKSGYPLAFGKRYCQAYMNREAGVSVRLGRWYQKVRYCLQESLIDADHEFNSCQELRAGSLHKHVQCYLESGYCDLSMGEKMQIAEVVGLNLFKKAIISVAIQVEAVCRYSQDGAR